MEKCYIDTRFVGVLRQALEEDLAAGMYVGEYREQAQTLLRKLEKADSPMLTSGEYDFLRSYVRDLVVAESRTGPYSS